MGKLIEPMKNTAVDVTTMAGAVSAVVGKSIKDPFASRCLRTFINLAVNSPELYYPLPERDDDNATEFQLARQGYTKWLPQATHTVQPYVDADVIRAYHDILNSDRFNDFQGWLHFQLLSPVVITHIDRVRGIVSDETQQHWAKCREEFAAYSDQLKLPEGQLQEKFRGHIKDFVTPNDFALCYGLDVLRRGWQYLERVTHAEGIYFAHPWRQVALSRSRSWKVTTEINGLSYSWGHYIDSLLQSDERYRTMPKVLGFVNALREAIDAEPSARWIHLKLTDASPLRSWSAAQKRLFRDEVYDAMEQIQRIAKRAKLPLRKKKAGKDNDDLFVVFLEAGIQALDNKVIDVFLLSFRFARIVAKKALPEKLYNQLEDKTLLIENQGRRAIDTFFQTVCRHGVYEYSGALPTIETT